MIEKIGCSDIIWIWIIEKNNNPIDKRKLLEIIYFNLLIYLIFNWFTYHN